MSNSYSHNVLYKRPLIVVLSLLLLSTFMILLPSCGGGGIGENQVTSDVSGSSGGSGITGTGTNLATDDGNHGGGVTGTGIDLADGGGVGSGGGVTGTGIISSGPIDAFGSIYVNGIRYNTDNATIMLNGVSVTQEVLALGMYVRVVGTVHDDGITGRADQVDFKPNLSGPVNAVFLSHTNGYKTATILGQSVLIHETDTVFSGTGFEAIGSSEWLEISGEILDDGRLLATRVETLSEKEDEIVRFTSEITSIEDDTLTFSNGVITDTANISLSSNDLNVGQRVEVLGRLEGDADEAGVEEREEETRVTATSVDTNIGFGEVALDADEGEAFIIIGNITQRVAETEIKVDDTPIDLTNAAVDPPNIPLDIGLNVRVEGIYDTEGGNASGIVPNTLYINTLFEEGRVESISEFDQQLTIELINRQQANGDLITLSNIHVDASTVYKENDIEGALTLSDLMIDDILSIAIQRNDALDLVATEITRTPTTTGVTTTNPAGHIRDTHSFVTEWTVQAGDLSIALPLLSQGYYDFTIDWGDDQPIDRITLWNDSRSRHSYALPGSYTVVINGDLEGFAFNNTGDVAKITEVSQWGSMSLSPQSTSPGSYFFGATNLDVTATDRPDLSYTTNLSQAFRNATRLDDSGNFNAWDTSHVTNMNALFQGASLFNQSLSNWNTLAVTDMSHLFSGASSFDQDISDWNVDNVANMNQILTGTALTTAHYDPLLVDWYARPNLQNGVTLDVGGVQYTAGSAAETARNNIVSDYGWSINDGGSVPISGIWIGGVDGNLSNGNNWDTGGINSASNITLGSSSDTITWDSPTTLADITLNGSFTGTLSALGNTFSSTGTITVNEGTLNSDSVISTVNYRQGTNGRLTLSLSGDPGNHGRINASSNTVLSGALTVLDGGLTLVDGDSFDILNGTIAGTFDTLDLPSLAVGLIWNLDALYTTGVIAVEAESPPMAFIMKFNSGADTAVTLPADSTPKCNRFISC